MNSPVTINSALGENWKPLSTEQLSNPFGFFQKARSEAPVFYSSALDMWVITQYQDVCNALNDYPSFSSEDTAPSPEAAKVGDFLYPASNAVGSNPPAHTRLRDPLNPAFSANRLADMTPAIRAKANLLVDQMCKAKQADFVSQFASPLPLSMVMTLFGSPQKDFDNFQRYSDALVAFMTVDMTAEQFKVASAGIEAYHQYLKTLIAEKRKNPGVDITSDLVTYPSIPALSENELVSTLTGLLFAGHPTIQCLISSALLTLLSKPERWQALLDDTTQLDLVVEEMLRFCSPVPTVIRRAKQDVTIKGVTIPNGSRVLMAMISANRDPSHFPHPDVYDPSRDFVASQLTFASGPHHCAGRVLARLQTKIALEVLLQRLPTLRLVQDQVIEYFPTLVIRGVKSLQLEWD